jgi:hypothetical protein
MTTVQLCTSQLCNVYKWNFNPLNWNYLGNALFRQHWHATTVSLNIHWFDGSAPAVHGCLFTCTLRVNSLLLRLWMSSWSKTVSLASRESENETHKRTRTHTHTHTITLINWQGRSIVWNLFGENFVMCKALNINGSHFIFGVCLFDKMQNAELIMYLS